LPVRMELAMGLEPATC